MHFAYFTLLVSLSCLFVASVSVSEEESSGSCPSDGHEDRMARIQILAAWAKDRGLVWHKDVVVKESPYGGVGLFTEESIKAGDVYVSFPVDMIVSPPLFHLDPYLGELPFVHAPDGEPFSVFQKLIIVAFFYMNCADAVEGGDRKPGSQSLYFDALPSACESSLCISDAELELLRETESDLYLMVVHWKKYVLGMFQKAKEKVFDLHPELFPDERVTYDGYLRAFAASRSRLFAVNYGMLADSPLWNVSGEESTLFSSFIPIMDLSNADFGITDPRMLEAARKAMRPAEDDGTRLQFMAHRDFSPGDEVLGGWYPTEDSASRWFLRYGNFPIADAVEDSVCLGCEKPDGDGLLQMCLSPKRVCSYVDSQLLESYLEYKYLSEPGNWERQHTKRRLIESLGGEVEERADAIDMDEIEKKAARISSPFVDSIVRLLEFEKTQFSKIYECLYEHYEENFP